MCSIFEKLNNKDLKNNIDFGKETLSHLPIIRGCKHIFGQFICKQSVFN